MVLNPNIPHPELSRLGDILEGEVISAQTLLDLLRAEHKLLQHNHFLELSAMAIKKEAQIVHLNTLAGEQGRLLQQLGITDDEDSTVRRLFAPPGMRELRMRWEALLELLQNCQRQNQINGQVLELAHRHNDRALGLLFGSHDTDNTYSRNGTRAAIAPTRYTALA